MQLQLKTWQFVEDYLKSKTGIIIPIGSTEQHGPTGLIGTDALTAEMIGRGVGEKVGALVAPTISVGMAQHHLDFAGSMTLRPTTLIAVVRDKVMSLARHGFTRFFFVNGHGGNIATVTAAFSEIYAERSMERLSNQPSIKCALRNWWDGAGIRQLSKELYPQRRRQPRHRLGSGAHLVQISRDDAPHAARAAHRAERLVRRRRGLSPRLSRRPHRLRSQPGHARARQALLRHRGRGSGARLREVGGAVGGLSAKSGGAACRSASTDLRRPLRGTSDEDGAVRTVRTRSRCRM